MAKNISTSKAKLLSTLPQKYDQLLREYVELLEKSFPNPYDLSIKNSLWGWFDIKGQIEYTRSPYITDFIKAPNTLAQDLPAASEMLERLSKFGDNELKAFNEMNNLNLGRLKKRSITEAIVPGVAFLGSLIGLLPTFQGIFPISIDIPILSALPQITISLLLKILVVFSLFIGIGNRMVTAPRIGIVNAFGDILKIVIAYRDIK